MLWETSFVVSKCAPFSIVQITSCSAVVQAQSRPFLLSYFIIFTASFQETTIPTAAILLSAVHAHFRLVFRKCTGKTLQTWRNAEGNIAAYLLYTTRLFSFKIAPVQINVLRSVTLCFCAFHEPSSETRTAEIGASFKEKIALFAAD